jgi:hypothetical protein
MTDELLVLHLWNTLYTSILGGKHKEHIRRAFLPGRRIHVVPETDMVGIP